MADCLFDGLGLLDPSLLGGTDADVGLRDANHLAALGVLLRGVVQD